MLREGLRRYLSPARLAALRAARVGLAGAGGLGSNTAMLLARCGVENFVLVDGDVVEPSNLNRQQYFPRHVGRPKVDALAEALLELNPHIHVEKRRLWLDSANMPGVLAAANIWVEALDAVPMKRAFVEAAMGAGAFTVSATGMAGWGGPSMKRRQLEGRLVQVGDFRTGIDMRPPLAPRVAQAAAMQADAVLEYVLGPCAAEAPMTRAGMETGGGENDAAG